MPKFLLKHSSSLYNRSLWNLSVASCVTHSKLENSFHEQQIPCGWPLLVSGHVSNQSASVSSAPPTLVCRLFFECIYHYPVSRSWWVLFFARKFSTKAQSSVTFFKESFKMLPIQKDLPLFHLKKKQHYFLCPYGLIL